MNEIVALFLAQHFINQPFVTRAAGCVYPLPKTDKITIPVAPVIFKTNPQGTVDCEIDQDYYDLIPDSKEVGILYFESIRGGKVIASNKRYNTWKGEVTLVFWGNMKRVGPDESLASLEGTISGDLPTEIPSSGLFYGGVLNWSAEVPKSINPFRKYTYDEARTKYLTAPYGFFSKTIKYVVRAARNCPTNIVLNPTVC